MKRLFTKIVAVASLIGIGAHTAQAAAPAPKVIRVGSAYSGGFGKPYGWGTPGVLQGLGLLEEEFKKDGIEVQWNIFKGAGPAVNESLANNTLDFAFIGDLPAIVGKAGGLKTKFIANSINGSDYYVAVTAGSPIRSIKDLKGKKVGVFKGTALQLAFARILAANGLKESDVKIYNLSGADLNAALKTGDVDAGISTNSLFTLRNQGIVRIIGSTKDYSKDFRVYGGVFVTEKFANAYPDITKRFVKRYVEAAKWGSEESNRRAVVNIFAKAGIAPGDFNEDIQGRLLKDISDPTINPALVNHFAGAIDYTKKNGLIRQTVDLNTWIDRSYINAALKDLKLEGYWK
ncbi:MAG: aliphatic sulfonate ABC transporter substrate-binding protein [Chlorobiaceae bacterium]|nr:aliphatic sulfonate ABC transporter substrate-binding protein [Chlorobiaceae bacterium]